jgi:hypothetical protein
MNLGWSKNDAKQPTIEFNLDPVPIMVRVRNYYYSFAKRNLFVNPTFFVLGTSMQSQQIQPKTNG